MEEQIRRMQQEIEAAAAPITDSKEMYLLRKQYLDNKTGKITALMKNMRDLSPEERPAFGKIVNELKQWALEFFTAQDARLKAEELARKNAAEQIDVTMPAARQQHGALHPNTLIVNELIDIFVGMGFTLFEGPEIENDYYNFTALNTPADHPARDMQDTFYITEDLLLRTQTSAGQIRVMENAQPPIKILSPGKVFRSDDDATHSPMFSQMEGLVVDKGITLCDLQGMLDVFAQRIFGQDVRTRLRPSYFPFIEPSVEVDVSCFACGGKGCRLCKDTGWIEVLGAGMVNRHVLENCGVDPDVYTGFTFGMGVERIAMLKYGIPNIKLLFESDVRVLEQFRD
ncbi:MAG: phenylalanine--tRNA ligase subunit alpha [Oscillospiraceae bacterium]|nr:phenylalanine--tRNA ligase subunit alpha [Oscillospiraceae bacterium]